MHGVTARLRWMEETQLACGSTSRRIQQGHSSHGPWMTRSSAPAAQLLVKGLGIAYPGARPWSCTLPCCSVPPLRLPFPPVGPWALWTRGNATAGICSPPRSWLHSSADGQASQRHSPSSHRAPSQCANQQPAEEACGTSPGPPLSALLPRQKWWKQVEMQTAQADGAQDICCCFQPPCLLHLPRDGPHGIVTLLQGLLFARGHLLPREICKVPELELHYAHDSGASKRMQWQKAGKGLTQSHLLGWKTVSAAVSAWLTSQSPGLPRLSQAVRSPRPVRALRSLLHNHYQLNEQKVHAGGAQEPVGRLQLCQGNSNISYPQPCRTVAAHQPRFSSKAHLQVEHQSPVGACILHGELAGAQHQMPQEEPAWLLEEQWGQNSHCC